MPAFSAARHGSLKGMRVRVDHSGDPDVGWGGIGVGAHGTLDEGWPSEAEDARKGALNRPGLESGLEYRPTGSGSPQAGKADRLAKYRSADQIPGEYPTSTPPTRFT